MALPSGAQTCCFILTADRAGARAFYGGVLGLRVLSDDTHAITCDTGNGTPLRLTDHAGYAAGPRTVLG